MATRERISLRELEEQTKKFLAPATEKERSIIEATAELMSERGIDGTTTAEIARRANVTEKTLFRYFPSKQALIDRILFPLLLRIGLSRGWEAFEKMLEPENVDFRAWYTRLAADRLATVSRNPGLARIVLIEVVQNEVFREALAKLWRQHIWRPMVGGLSEMQARGAVRSDINVETVARAIHCLHVGYFLTRHLFAPDRNWDDKSQIDKMADLLTNGSSNEGRRPARPRSRKSASKVGASS